MIGRIPHNPIPMREGLLAHGYLSFPLPISLPKKETVGYLKRNLRLQRRDRDGIKPFFPGARIFKRLVGVYIDVNLFRLPTLAMDRSATYK